MNIPSLETERLILRAPNYDDWASYAELHYSDRSRYLGGPYSESRTWGVFCSEIALWELFGVGALMIDKKATGECVGLVSVNYGPFYKEHEIGWLLYQNFEGFGYAYEAARQLKKWAFKERKLTTLVSYINPQNRKSCRLAERLGAAIDHNAQRYDPADIVYRYPAPD